MNTGKEKECTLWTKDAGEVERADVLPGACHTQVGPVATPWQLTVLPRLPSCGQILIVSYFRDGTGRPSRELTSTQLVFPGARIQSQPAIASPS